LSANRCAKPLQQKASSVYELLWIAFTCNAHSMILRKLRITLMGTRSLSHYLQFLQPAFVAATCVLHLTSSIASFVPLNSVHSQALLLLSLYGVYSNSQGYTQKHTYSFAIPRFISLHFRSTTSLIHYSRIQSTAAYNLRALRPTMATGLT
jgi:hypothetical protein